MNNIFPALNLFAWLLVFTAPGCKAQPPGQISGHIELHPEWKPFVYLVQPRNFSEIASDYLGQVLDSANISKDGTFSFKHVSVQEDRVLLELVMQKTKSRFANHLTDSIPIEANYMPIIFTKGNAIELKADANAFQKKFTFINPSGENVAIASLRDIRLTAFKKLMASEASIPEDEALLNEREKVHQHFTQTLMDFADSTSCLEAAMLAIRWISPTGDFERIPEFIASQCQQWSVLNPEHPYTKQLCVLAEKSKLPIMLGDVMPDFPLPLMSGDTVSLSSLLGDKLTLLDIWASWCAPCRKEIREEVIPLWNIYHEKGFQVIGYSIDANASSWKNAISKDGSGWTQASHLTGDSTPLMDVLRITTIPANYVLDAHGKILAKNLHGEELREFIENGLK